MGRLELFLPVIVKFCRLHISLKASRELRRAVTMERQISPMFWRAKLLLRPLNAFLHQLKALLRSHFQTSPSAGESHPLCLFSDWLFLLNALRSMLMHFEMKRAEIRPLISPTPIGRSPWFLSKRIILQALYGRITSLTFHLPICEQMMRRCDADWSLTAVYRLCGPFERLSGRIYCSDKLDRFPVRDECRVAFLWDFPLLFFSVSWKSNC